MVGDGCDDVCGFPSFSCRHSVGVVPAAESDFLSSDGNDRFLKRALVSAIRSKERRMAVKTF